MNFQPEYSLSLPEGEHFWIFFSQGEKNILIQSNTGSPVHFGDFPVLSGHLLRSFMIGRQESSPVSCAEVKEDETLPAGLEWAAFSDIYRNLKHSIQHPVSRAKKLLNWDRTHKFCGVCGAETQLKENMSARFCPSCSEMFFPRLSPAIIVRITRGDRIMLAHNKNFPEGLYSHIAGFVEAGESLEQAVRREIMEEVQLEVTNIRYFGSQPWPMPHSLMVAFTADCPVGDPIADGMEISDARWFTRDNLPLPPSSKSIAMTMINDFLQKEEA